MSLHETDKTDMEDVTEKISKLLAKAERTDNPAEAEAYSAKAIELMTKYAIDMALVQSTKTVKTDVITRRDIPLTGLQYPQVRVNLASVISRAFRCEPVLTQRWSMEDGKKVRIRVLTVLGFESDINHVVALFHSLLIQQTNGMLSTPIPEWTHGKTFRQSFAIGFNHAIAQRLHEMNNRARNDAKATNPGTDLVLADRTQMVKAELNRAFPRLRTTSGPSSRDDSGYGEGYRKGQRADMGQTRIDR
jgi:hypothetical protein